MKLKLLAAAATAALMAVPSVAQADEKGWYLRGNAGYGTHTDVDLTGSMVGTVESEGNAAVSAGIGYDFGNNWRLEVDGASLWTDMGKISKLPNSFAKLRTNTLMLNALYDFETFGRWEPYIGAGIGMVRGRASAQAHDFPSTALTAGGVVPVDTPACVAGVACDISNGDSGLAYQFLAGLGYDITNNLTWDTQYRYQRTNSLDFDTDVFNTVGGTAGAGKTSFEGVGAHMLMTGFRYKFGAAPAPVTYTCWDGSVHSSLASCPAMADVKCWDGSMVFNASECPAEPVRTKRCWDGSEIPVDQTCPAEPPRITCWDGSIVSDATFCPPETRSGVSTADLCGNQYRQEIIYYEFDKGQSAETRNTINRILDVGQFCHVDNIRVVGHTDTSGSAAYNLNLSKRRAKDAKDELIRQGINSAIITSEGKGETEPFIPTGDGVKEQLNRRTEVLIQLSQVGAK